MTTSEDKRALRASLLSRKMRLGKDEVDKMSEAAIKKLIGFLDWAKVRNIHIYIPITANNELNTWPFIKHLRDNFPNVMIYLPKLDGFAKLDSYAEVRENRLGIPEPITKTLTSGVQFDVIIIPTIGFDRRGYRLGYGAGYYDRFLAKHRSKNVIGLSYAMSEIDKVPDEPHDKKMHTVITEKEIISVS
ncbi:MAG TPA: 5-formyltetrahydrofolate cyclo-ligase [Candidatus Saccharimonadales bacterium]|nr:5-formyltetrahydrofolate cyclo-ligase [Candidatus Saccharimonadales bacterium]